MSDESHVTPPVVEPVAAVAAPVASGAAVVLVPVDEVAGSGEASTVYVPVDVPAPAPSSADIVPPTPLVSVSISGGGIRASASGDTLHGAATGRRASADIGMGASDLGDDADPEGIDDHKIHSSDSKDDDASPVPRAGSPLSSFNSGDTEASTSAPSAAAAPASPTPPAVAAPSSASSPTSPPSTAPVVVTSSGSNEHKTSAQVEAESKAAAEQAKKEAAKAKAASDKIKAVAAAAAAKKAMEEAKEEQQSREDEERMRVVWAAKDEGFAAMKVWESKRHAHSEKLNTTTKNNRVRLMTQLTHGRNEVAQVKNHLEVRVKALTAHAQALNNTSGSLTTLGVSGLGELGKHVAGVEEASSSKVSQLAKFISEDLVTRQLDVLAIQCKKVLKNVQTEETKESTGLLKQTQAVVKAFGEYTEMFSAGKKMTPGQQRKDLFIAELKYRNTVLGLVQLQGAYQEAVLRLFGTFRVEEKQRVAIVRSVLEAYAGKLSIAWNQPTSIIAPAPAPAVPQPPPGPPPASARATSPPPPPPPPAKHVGPETKESKLAAYQEEEKKKKALTYQFQLNLPACNTLVRVGRFELHGGLDKDKKAIWKPVLCLLTIDWFLHCFELDDKAMPIDASDEPLALRPEVVPASSAPVVTHSRRSSTGAVAAGASVASPSSSPAAPVSPPPAAAVAVASPSGAMLHPHFVLPVPPQLPIGLPSVPTWSVDLLLQGQAPVHRTDLDYLIIDIGTPEPKKERKGFALLNPFGRSTKTRPVYTLRGTSRPDVDAWLAVMRL